MGWRRLTQIQSAGNIVLGIGWINTIPYSEDTSCKKLNLFNAIFPHEKRECYTRSIKKLPLSPGMKKKFLVIGDE
jgi:hypothetical protein